MARIGVDIDGVLYDFAASVRQFMSGHNAFAASECGSCMDDYPDATRWEFYEDWGLSLSEFKDVFAAGVNAGVIFRVGEPHEGSFDALTDLVAQGHTLHAVTDRLVGDPGEAQGATYAWLAEHDLLPLFDSVTFSADKTVVDVDYFIEDKLANYDRLKLAGVRVFLLDRPWNQDGDDPRRRVASLADFAEAVRADEHDRRVIEAVTGDDATDWLNPVEREIGDTDTPLARTLMAPVDACVHGDRWHIGGPCSDLDAVPDEWNAVRGYSRERGKDNVISVDFGSEVARAYPGEVGTPLPTAGMPRDAAARKATPIASGVLDYFPDALCEVARVSKIGNDQHNPGQPMHWAKEKSGDEADALVRHLLERGTFDTDGARHSGKVAWRALALLQRELDAEAAAQFEGGPDEAA